MTASKEDDQLYRIPAGDGDPAFFSKPLLLRKTYANWFPGKVLRGEAMLFIVVDGRYAGEYVALTTRTLAPLQEQITTYGWASVVVHRIKNPTPSFDGSENDADPVGMAYVEIVKPT